MSDIKAEGLWESMFNFRVGGVLTYLRNTYLGPVAVWTDKVDIVLTDPDDYETMRYLVNKCGISFFNTDLPRDFLPKFISGNGYQRK